ncbi:unnamed protein product [Cuscuta campestris]|uniref:Transposase (putative) gypsy type domain-containing protein n=1 Tax=Cuscuta campestris TaxID=132261 RepID=A0A484NCM2_9ASTE|nr:unnamed protein product [Cuscuta campestris]
MTSSDSTSTPVVDPATVCFEEMYRQNPSLRPDGPVGGIDHSRVLSAFPLRTSVTVASSSQAAHLKKKKKLKIVQERTRKSLPVTALDKGLITSTGCLLLDVDFDEALRFVGDGYVVRRPHTTNHVFSVICRDAEVGVHVASMRYGLRFPPHDLIVQFLNFYRLLPGFPTVTRLFVILGLRPLPSFSHMRKNCWKTAGLNHPRYTVCTEQNLAEVGILISLERQFELSESVLGSRPKHGLEESAPRSEDLESGNEEEEDDEEVETDKESEQPSYSEGIADVGPSGALPSISFIISVHLPSPSQPNPKVSPFFPALMTSSDSTSTPVVDPATDCFEEMYRQNPSLRPDGPVGGIDHSRVLSALPLRTSVTVASSSQAAPLKKKKLKIVQERTRKSLPVTALDKGLITSTGCLLLDVDFDEALRFVGDGYVVRRPHTTNHVFSVTCRDAEVGVHVASMRYGLRFPPHDLIIQFLNFYRLLPGFPTVTRLFVILGLRPLPSFSHMRKNCWKTAGLNHPTYTVCTEQNLAEVGILISIERQFELSEAVLGSRSKHGLEESAPRSEDLESGNEEEEDDEEVETDEESEQPSYSEGIADVGPSGALPSISFIISVHSPSPSQPNPKVSPFFPALMTSSDSTSTPVVDLATVCFEEMYRQNTFLRPDGPVGGIDHSRVLSALPLRTSVTVASSSQAAPLKKKKKLKIVQERTRKSLPVTALDKGPITSTGCLLLDVDFDEALRFVGDGYVVRRPHTTNHVFSVTCRDSEVGVHVASMRYGLRFPPHDLIVQFLNFYRLLPGQLSPHSYYCFSIFLIKCHQRGVPWSLDLFRYMFKISKVGAREGNSYAVVFSQSECGMDVFPTSLKLWKAKFVFVSGFPGNRHPPQARFPDGHTFIRHPWPEATPELLAHAQKLLEDCRPKPPHVYTVCTEQNLAEVGILISLERQFEQSEAVLGSRPKHGLEESAPRSEDLESGNEEEENDEEVETDEESEQPSYSEGIADVGPSGGMSST